MSRFTTSAPLSRREVIRDAVTTLGGRRHRDTDAFTVLSRDAMQGIADRALKRSTADGCEITVTSTVAGNTRFAANQLATAGDVTDTTVTVNTFVRPEARHRPD